MTVIPFAATATLAIALSASTAFAAGPRIAVVAPDSGNLQVLGDQVRLGAAAAAGTRAELVPIAESCTEGSGRALAETIAAAKVVAAIGFLCTESLEGGLATLATAKVPAITLSIRSEVLMQDALKKDWPFFRLAPSTGAERDAVAEAIFTHWKDKPFALLDDGTILSRELTDSVRQILEQKGMTAAFIDNFRPAQEVQIQLMRRLKKANVTHVFAASDRNDMSIMARDAKVAGAGLTFMGSDALKGMNQPVPLEPGVFAVTLPEAATLPSAKPAMDLIQREKKTAEGYVLPAYSSVEIVVAANEIAAGSGATLSEALVDTPFSTALGEIRFGKDHELTVNPYRMLVWDGSGFVEPEARN
jgi:branched-chain amino acid transport system substrate-binding protein